jgi:hypothetical protein
MDVSSSEAWEEEIDSPMVQAALKKLGWDEICEAVSQHASTALGQAAAKDLLLPETRLGTEVPRPS